MVNPTLAAVDPALATAAVELAWPIAALVIAIMFRKPVESFLHAVHDRVTKVSLFNVELELKRLEDVTGQLPGLMSIRKSDPVAWTGGDSSSDLFQQLSSTASADYAIVDLGEGQEWLTSRLFILAVMLERLRSVRCIVFLATLGGRPRSFLGYTHPSRVRWGIALREPWLEVAFAAAYAQQFSYEIPSAWNGPVVISLSGAMEPHRVTNLVRTYLESLQRPAGAGGAAPEWVDLTTKEERASWISTEGMSRILALTYYDRHSSGVIVTRHMTRAAKADEVLLCNGPFAALLNPDGTFSGLVDREALVEEFLATRQEDEARRGSRPSGG